MPLGEEMLDTISTPNWPQEGYSMATKASPVVDFPVGPDPFTAQRLPANYYLDEDILNLEKERIFCRSWLLAGHVSQLPRSGSYFTLEILGERLFFVRGGDDVVRGFYNVCRHRAHELVQGTGCRQAITCPYHAWTYELDGKLRFARNSEQVAGFDATQFGLVAVRVERFLDFLFFNLDPDATSFATLLPGLESELREYVPRLDDLLVDPGAARGDGDTLKCNWKILLDNCMECYHCAPAHPAFADLVALDTYRISCHDLHTTHVAVSNKTHNTAYDYDRAPAVRHAAFWHLWPNITLGVMPGSPNFGAYSIDPVALDVTRPRSYSLRLPGAPTEQDRARDEYSANVLWPEDLGLCESVQRGIASRAYTRGPFMVGDMGDRDSEIAIHFFQRRICEALAADSS